MVARALHRLSPRRDRKLVVCDCTAIPESLFESELFGYERGAFTGADKAKPGILRDSDGSTLFLDEIGEIPLHVQTKLLRVLEEHNYRPLGSNAYVEIDVRVICATNKVSED
jgi:transcriptional regulator with GAF, ATPase, and Fis domain